MISLSDLVHLAHLYPPGSLEDPVYALAGGSAVQCWLQDSGRDREHHDIDLIAFHPRFLTSSLSVAVRNDPFFVGELFQDSIIPLTDTAAVPLQITQGSYYDSEIIPTVTDVRSVAIGTTFLPALSPEFIAVSKLSYPNMHRLCDFRDVLALNQQGCLQDPTYLSDLLKRTSLGCMVSAQDILRLKTQDDLQALVDAIHAQLIRRFLYWEGANVDALDPFQFFVLLDMDEKLLQAPSEIEQFLETLFAKTLLSGRRLQIAKVGLYFLTIGVPSWCLSILHHPDFRAVISHGLALLPQYPSLWLSLSKTVFMVFQELVQLERLAHQQLDWLWSPASLVKIIERIFFDDPSRLALLASLRFLCYAITTCQATNLDSLDFAQSFGYPSKPSDARTLPSFLAYVLPKIIW